MLLFKLHIPERSKPYARSDADFFERSGDLRHVAEFFVRSPRPRAGVDRPTVVYHGERAVLIPKSKGSGHFRIPHDVPAAAVAVGIIPVIAAVYRRGGQAGVFAHHAAEPLCGGKRRNAAVFPTDNDARKQPPSVQSDAHAAAAHIEPCGTTRSVALKAHKAASARHDAAAHGRVAAVCEKIPRHEDLPV